MKDEISVYAYTGFLILICAPYPVLGLGMMMSGVFLTKIIRKQVKIKEVCSIPNLCSIPFLAVTVLLYRKTLDSNLHFVVKYFYKNNTFLMILTGVIIVTFFAFGIYIIFLDHEQKGYLLYVSEIAFVACYFVGIGSEADLTMRAIIPMYFYFMVLVMQVMFDIKSQRWRKNILTGLIGISGVIQLNLIFVLGKTGTVYHTFRVPYDALYTFSNHYGIHDNGFLDQYTKLNPSSDFFYNSMCKGSCEITKPVIEYAAKMDENGDANLYVKKVSIKDEFIEAFTKSVISDDQKALEIRLQKECAKSNDPVVVYFDENELIPCPGSDPGLHEDDFELNWTNYNYYYHEDKLHIPACVEVEYTGKQPIQIWQQTNPQYGSGISCALYDDQGNIIQDPWAYTYTKHVIYSGQKEKYVFGIPKPEKRGRYKLVLKFFYHKDQVYASFAQKEYFLELR